jgi:hypothetical protein
MDKTKHVEGVTVESSNGYWRLDKKLISLRGPKGRGQNDAIHDHLTNAGYEPGVPIIILPKADYEELLRKVEGSGT